MHHHDAERVTARRKRIWLSDRRPLGWDYVMALSFLNGPCHLNLTAGFPWEDPITGDCLSVLVGQHYHPWRPSVNWINVKRFDPTAPPRTACTVLLPFIEVQCICVTSLKTFKTYLITTRWSLEVIWLCRFGELMIAGAKYWTYGNNTLCVWENFK